MILYYIMLYYIILYYIILYYIILYYIILYYIILHLINEGTKIAKIEVSFHSLVMAKKSFISDFLGNVEGLWMTFVLPSP